MWWISAAFTAFLAVTVVGLGFHFLPHMFTPPPREPDLRGCGRACEGGAMRHQLWYSDGLWRVLVWPDRFAAPVYGQFMSSTEAWAWLGQRYELARSDR